MKLHKGKATNEDRAENALLALETYESLKDGGPSDEPFAQRVGDLLSDLLHLGVTKGEQLVLVQLVQRAQTHFEAELAEEDQA